MENNVHICSWCGKQFEPKKTSSKTCSPTCGAKLREAVKRRK